MLKLAAVEQEVAAVRIYSAFSAVADNAVQHTVAVADQMDTVIICVTSFHRIYVSIAYSRGSRTLIGGSAHIPDKNCAVYTKLLEMGAGGRYN